MKTKRRQTIWTILAALSILYGLFILAGGSGTGFFVVWLALGLLFLAMALAAKKELWRRLPKAFKAISLTIVIAGLALTAFLTAQILSGFHKTAGPGCDYLIVLGAQVYETGPSVVLRCRLDAAADYLKENEETLCIVTGRKGYNEPVSEAEGMRDYLISVGIDEERILLEPLAKNTRENLLYSRKLLSSPEASVAIVTNNFHVYRALVLAKEAGIADVSAISAPSVPWYLPNNILREVLALMKEYLFSRL